MTLSAEQRSQVEEWYRAGIGTTYIASRVGVSRQAIAALLRRRGIDLRSQLKLTDSDKDAAVRWYVAGESTAQIGEKLNVSSVTVLKVLRQRGAEVRGGREGQRDHAFDEFTPEAAYWVGFLFADGCVFTRAGHQPVISVGIAARDHSQLVKLKAFLGSSNSISLVKGKHPSCRLWVTSAALASRLIAAGRYSGPIDPKLVGSRHFWRLTATIPGPEMPHADVITHPEMLAVARLLVTAQHYPGAMPGSIADRLGFPYPSSPHPLEPLQACLAQLTGKHAP